ncbi:MAG TPA: SurA N-terminal domain-containing protein, partial [Gammaproteobacteria bacterium]|nr:SurA N-terminal domain-containing protein [Gammaproteobacteria bacterium]
MRTVVLSLTFILALVAGLPAQAKVVQLDRVVAVVDDDVVTHTELAQRLNEIRRRLRQQGTPVPPQDVLRRQVLERLVLERIQLKRAQARGVQVQDQAVNQVLRNIAADNGLDLRRFRQVLERDGYDFAQFREQIRNEMLIRRLRTRQVDNRVTVTPQEVERFLEQKARRGGSDREYQLSHILIAVPEAADPKEVQAARQEAE